MEKRDREMEEMLKAIGEYMDKEDNYDYILNEENFLKLKRIKKAIEEMFGEDAIKVETSIMEAKWGSGGVRFEIPSLDLSITKNVGFSMNEFLNKIANKADFVSFYATNNSGNIWVSFGVSNIYEKIKKEN